MPARSGRTGRSPRSSLPPTPRVGRSSRTSRATGSRARAAIAGVDAFAHTPFTERLDDALIAQLAASTTWISTLRIHAGRDRETAIDNLRRFRAAGGRILYGTDMGNGPSSGGVERDELEALVEAGLTHDDLVAALTGGSLLPALAFDRSDGARCRPARLLGDT